MQVAYKNAKDVLPEPLLRELQKYVDGDILYIPSKSSQKAGWGKLSGARNEYEKRNKRIKTLHGEENIPFDKLADIFCLSVDSIRKIVK